MTTIRDLIHRACAYGRRVNIDEPTTIFEDAAAIDAELRDLRALKERLDPTIETWHDGGYGTDGRRFKRFISVPLPDARLRWEYMGEGRDAELVSEPALSDVSTGGLSLVGATLTELDAKALAHLALSAQDAADVAGDEALERKRSEGA